MRNKLPGYYCEGHKQMSVKFRLLELDRTPPREQNHK